VLGAQIKRLRKLRGLTQVELADKLGITQAYLAQLESGVRANPTLDLLQRIAKALKVDITKLLR